MKGRPRRGIPREIGTIREAHEDATAEELSLCEAVEARQALVAEIETTREIGWTDWTRLRMHDRVIEEYAFRCLNQSRRINALFAELYGSGSAFDGDARAHDPELGEITVGEVLRRRDEIEATQSDSRSE